MLLLLTSLALAAEAPVGSLGSEVPTLEPAVSVSDSSAERLQDFEKYRRRVQVAESALFLSYLGYLPLVVAVSRSPDFRYSPPQLALIMGPAVLGIGMFCTAIPWMAIAGRRAELALIDLGGQSRPWISKVAVLSFSAGLTALVLGSTLISIPAVYNGDLFGPVFSGTILASTGLILVSLPLSIAQLQHLNQHHPEGPVSGTRLHGVLVGPFVSKESAGLSLSARF